MQNTRSICEDARCEDFDRVRFFNGQLLTAEDFDLQTEYFRKHNREHNINLHGDGVIWGLGVRKAEGWKVIVEKGAAIDCFGNEMHVRSEQIVNLEEIIRYGDSGTDGDREFVLCIKYNEEEGCPAYKRSHISLCNGPQKENARIKEEYTFEVCEISLEFTYPEYSNEVVNSLEPSVGPKPLSPEHSTLETSCIEKLHREMVDLTLEPLPTCIKSDSVPIASITVKQEDEEIISERIDQYNRKLAVSTRDLFEFLVSHLCKVDVRISPSYLEICPKEHFRFHASVKNAINKEVKWSVVDENGDAGTIDEHGIYICPEVKTEKSITIRAESKEDSRAYDTAIIKLLKNQ